MDNPESSTILIVDRPPVEVDFIPGDESADDFAIDFVADDACAARAIEDNDPWQALLKESAERPGVVVEVMVFNPLDGNGNPAIKSDDLDIDGLMEVIDSLDPTNAEKPKRRGPPPLPTIEDFLVIEIDPETDPDVLEYRAA